MATANHGTTQNTDIIHGIAPKDWEKIKRLKEFMTQQHSHGKDSSHLVDTSAHKYVLLPEIWELILLKLTTTLDLKNVSLVCHLFRDIVINRLWNSPKLKNGLTADNLKSLKHLPIQCLNGTDIGKLPGKKRNSDVVKLLDALCSFPQLTSLKLGWNINLNYWMIGRIARTENLTSLSIQNFYPGCATAFKQLESLKLDALYIEESVYDLDVEPVLESISKMKTLRILEVHTTDSTCIYLTKLPHLEELTINWSTLSDVSYKLLSQIKTLKKLRFEWCYEVSENIHLITSSLPNILIEIENEKNQQQEDEDEDEYYTHMEETYGEDWPDMLDYDESDLPEDFNDHYQELHLCPAFTDQIGDRIGQIGPSPYHAVQKILETYRKLTPQEYREYFGNAD